MLCFEVQLNGEIVARAGVPDGVLSAILTSVANPADGLMELDLEVAGFRQDTHLRWTGRPVQIGDRIEIHVLDEETPDPPAREYRNESLTEESERRYYERLKEKYEP